MKRLNYLWLIVLFQALFLLPLYGVEPDGDCDGESPGPTQPTKDLKIYYNNSESYFEKYNPTFQWCFYYIGEGEDALWKATVTKLIVKGDAYIKNWPAEKTPAPTEGGNVTSNNWQSIIADLQNYDSKIGGGEGPDWHSTFASEAHEFYHWNQDWQQTCIMAYWPACETAIESYQDKDFDALKAKVNQRFNLFVTQVKNKWESEVMPKDKPGYGGGAYAAGQAVLNQIIGEVLVFADQQGWDN